MTRLSRLRQLLKSPSSKILILQDRGIGDAVLLSSFIDTILSFSPKIHIDLGLNHWGSSLYEHDPRIQRIFSIRESTLTELRFENYDLCFALRASKSTAIKGLLAVSPTRPCVIHFHHQKAWHFLSSFPFKEPWQVLPSTLRDQLFFKQLDLVSSEEIPSNPRLFLTSQEVNSAKCWLKTKIQSQEKPLIFLGLGASRPTKKWPLEKYKELLLSMKSSFNFISCLLHQDSSEQNLLESLGIPFLMNGTLREVMGLLSQSQLYIGHDTGTKHIAAALDVPTITLFGPENPLEWHPYDQKRHPFFFQSELKCRGSWCPLKICTEHHHQCMSLISVESVSNQAKEILTP